MSVLLTLLSVVSAVVTKHCLPGVTHTCLRQKNPIRLSKKKEKDFFLPLTQRSLTGIKGASVIVEWPQCDVATTGFQGHQPQRAMGGCFPIVPPAAASRLSPSPWNSLSTTCNVSQHFPCSARPLLNQNLKFDASSEEHYFKEFKEKDCNLRFMSERQGNTSVNSHHFEVHDIECAFKKT